MHFLIGIMLGIGAVIAGCSKISMAIAKCIMHFIHEDTTVFSTKSSINRNWIKCQPQNTRKGQQVKRFNFCIREFCLNFFFCITGKRLKLKFLIFLAERPVVASEVSFVKTQQIKFID